jgi:tetratricopeptide (TPR) repeat protein
MGEVRRQPQHTSPPLPADPTSAPVALAREREREGDRALDAHDLEGALSCYDQALAISPTLARLHRKRGVVLCALGRWDDAFGAANEACELDLSDDAAYTLRVVSCFHNNPDQMIAVITEEIEAHPTSGRARLVRGIVRLTKKDFEGALSDMNRALELAPGDMMVLVSRGGLRRLMGDLDGALDDANHVLAIEPTRVSAYVLAATTLEDMGLPDRAAEKLERYIALVPDAPEAAAVLAMIERLKAKGRR